MIFAVRQVALQFTIIYIHLIALKPLNPVAATNQRPERIIKEASEKRI